MRPRAAVVTIALTLLAVTLPLGAARATGAQFLTTVKQFLEEPGLAL